ncbi:hypothetical protein MKW98_000930, partial [Papaver atlanticum]
MVRVFGFLTIPVKSREAGRIRFWGFSSTTAAGRINQLHTIHSWAFLEVNAIPQYNRLTEIESKPEVIVGMILVKMQLNCQLIHSVLSNDMEALENVTAECDFDSKQGSDCGEKEVVEGNVVMLEWLADWFSLVLRVQENEKSHILFLGLRSILGLTRLYQGNPDLALIPLWNFCDSLTSVGLILHMAKAQKIVDGGLWSSCSMKYMCGI